jgi:hypothetical protein
MISRTFQIVVLCASLGCAVKTEKSGDTSVATTVDTISTGSQSPGTSASQPSLPPVPSPDSARPPAGTSFTIAPDSYGPLRVGMTVAQASTALGGGIAAPKGYSGGCGYAVLVKAPSGLAVMLNDGKIARFEIRSGGIKTTEGARIGDSETRIKSLYAGRVTSTPHKYVTGGHYLTVVPPGSDLGIRIVFETDGSKVTEYRSGKTPEVEQVERCG